MSLDVMLMKVSQTSAWETIKEEVYYKNITHNLAKMATHIRATNEKNICLYDVLWKPYSIGIVKLTPDYVKYLETASLDMLLHKEYLEYMFTPSNGWGSFNTLHEAVIEILEECIERLYDGNEYEIQVSI